VERVKLCEILLSMEPSSDSLAETLRRVIQAQGRLLRVDRAPLGGPSGARASSALRLTFDVGIITLRPGGNGGDLRVQIGSLREAGSPELLCASEEDPWWRVMGCSLGRVEARPGGGVLLQFRGDQENPRRFAVFPHRGGIEVSEEG
jgi:hypothetical protein